MDWDVFLSTATSPQDRSVLWLKYLGDSTSNSHQTEKGCGCKGIYKGALWSWELRQYVIGNLVLGVTPRAKSAQLMPARTLFRDDWSCGSGRPGDNYRFRTAVNGASPRPQEMQQSSRVCVRLQGMGRYVLYKGCGTALKQQCMFSALQSLNRVRNTSELIPPLRMYPIYPRVQNEVDEIL